ncbi:MAG: hypothetical protein MUF31_01415 [Akkermansiaceae bacterium]|nr:hypothetical protein [Akkermansiaceae bacterium]
MSGRYEIFDILSQDADGVVFHAEDRQSGAEVALRRFFPFGAGGGGLEGEERTAYEIAVRRLIGVQHPALRNVLDGGIDPVDGMPFLITEWLDGQQLSKRLAERPLSPGSAKSLAQFALDACQLLSELFQEEAVWIETSPDTIVLVPQDAERPITFWISPLRWLGQSRDRHGLGSLLQLVEESTGWRGCFVQDSAGDGLGAWVKALRKDPFRWTLAQARAALDDPMSFIQEAPAPREVNNDPPTIRPMAPVSPTIRPPMPAPIAVAPPRTPIWPWLMAGLLTLAAGVFIFIQSQKPKLPPPSAVVAAGGEVEKEAPAPATEEIEDRSLSPAEIASARAAQLAGENAGQAQPAPEDTAGLASEALNRRLIEIGSQLRGAIGQPTEMEGMIYRVRASNSGKTIYLEFGSSVEPNAICARHLPEGDAQAALEKFQTLVGKNVRVKGTVVADPSGRIAIDLESFEAVTSLGS